MTRMAKTRTATARTRTAAKPRRKAAKPAARAPRKAAKPAPRSAVKPVARIFNFGAGPATMPVEVLEKAKWELVNWHEAGMSVMEMSHRGKEFVSIAGE